MLHSRNFTIASPSATWTIEHNFGVTVNADVFVEDGGVLQKSYPAEMTQDEERNVLTITWSEPRVGGVRVICVNDSRDFTSNPSWIPDDAANV